MAISPSFTSTQLIGQPSIVRLIDTSTGSDVNVVEKRVTLVNALNQYVVPAGTTTNYIVWSLASSSININCLSESTALQVTVNWVDVNGNTVVSATGLYGYPLFAEQFYYTLTQMQTGDPNIIQDTNYYSNKMILRVELDSAMQAIVLASDIYGAQSCYVRATSLVNNQSLFF